MIRNASATASAVMAADWPFLREALAKRTKLSAAEIDEGVLEFKKYLILVLSRDCEIAMVSPTVDEVWHQFIQFTKEYREFCVGELGEFIDHQPNTTTTPVPKSALRNFVNAYLEIFGRVPEIWFKGVDKSVVDFCFGKTDVLPATYQWSGWAGRSSKAR